MSRISSLQSIIARNRSTIRRLEGRVCFNTEYCDARNSDYILARKIVAQDRKKIKAYAKIQRDLKDLLCDMIHWEYNFKEGN